MLDLVVLTLYLKVEPLAHSFFSIYTIIRPRPGRDDGDEDYYHEYYQTILYGRVNGKLVNESKTKEIQCCESKSFCDAGFGKYILIINAMPEHCDLTDTVFSALPYIIANLYGILPDMIFDMTQVLGKKSA